MKIKLNCYDVNPINLYYIYEEICEVLIIYPIIQYHWNEKEYKHTHTNCWFMQTTAAANEEGKKRIRRRWNDGKKAKNLQWERALNWELSTTEPRINFFFLFPLEYVEQRSCIINPSWLSISWINRFSYITST